MCLCWNDDGSLCSSEELKRRMVLYNKGLYKPELKAMRERLAEQRRRESAERVAALTDDQKEEMASTWRMVFNIS